MIWVFDSITSSLHDGKFTTNCSVQGKPFKNPFIYVAQSLIIFELLILNSFLWFVFIFHEDKKEILIVAILNNRQDKSKINNRL
jgi:formate-dependent nitrite reductase membrane component NrfD